MFAACPHCGYLVALIVAKDGPTRACPRCGGDLAAAAAIESMPGESASVKAASSEPASSEAASTAVADGIDATAAEVSAAGGTAAPAQAADVEDEYDQAGHLAGPASPAEPATRDSANTSDDPAAMAAPTAALAPLSAAADAVVPKRATRKRAGKSETAVAHARLAPSFVRSRARAAAPAARRHWSGPAVAIALGLLLALQLLLAQRDELAADARWRPLVGALCGALPCTIPAWREPAALTMLNRNVLPVAERTGVLRVSASFRNDARWAQPWPVLEIALHDLDGQSLGMRRFTPTEYLGSPPAETAIAPGQSASATLEILDPGSRAVAFTFDFH